MQNVKVQFKGITRNTDDGMCSDGECMELINAHLENGSIEPIGKPILLKGLQRAYKKIYYHTNAKKYIGIDTDGRLYEISEDLTTEEVLTGDLTAIDVAFVGNTIAVSTSDGLRYILYKQGEYKYLGALPELPEIKIDKKLRTFQSDATADNSLTYGQYLECISKGNKEGFYSYSAAFRIAYRLYDGSYVKHSHIRPLFLTENDTYTTYNPDPKQEVTFKGDPQLFPANSYASFQLLKNEATKSYKSTLLMFQPIFNIAAIDLSDWSDIIMSIDVFSTEGFRLIFNHAIPDGTTDDLDKPLDRFTNTSRYYLLDSVQPSNEATEFIYEKDVSADILATKEVLVDDSYSHNTYIYNHLSSYNNKLHAWGRTELLFDWYDNQVFYDNTTEPGSNVDLYVFIEGYTKEITLKKTLACPKKFGPFLMYPDTRAKGIAIVNKTLNKSKYFTLKKHPTLNVAYYCKEASVRGEGYGSFALEDMTTWEDGSFSYITTSNEDREDDNILRVSELSNPFTFPADQTYQFNTPIIGVQSNVIAMSQGQFGQFPLYVFTKEGIYALSVGQGDVSYATQTPVTRDVCTNPNSICGLDTAVAFATDKGLMVISGTQTQLISETIYGFLPSCTLSSPIIPKILAVAGMENVISSVVFPDYLKDANVGYNYQRQQIIVANKDYPYSYVYSMKTGAWFKIDKQIDFFVNSYPYTWAYSQQGIYDLNNDHRTISTIALVTRPIKLGTMTYKRILQTALRGIVKRSLSDLYYKGEPVMFRGDSVDIFSDVGMYILGSNDCEHFNLVAKKEMMVDIRDLVTKMNKSKPYKYFMICLVGGVRTDVSINYIEMNIDESFTNRLR